MPFAAELEIVLPPDLPNRRRVIENCARHLDMVAEVNQHMNLTRITSAREAAIKHVLDSVMPWRLFQGLNTVMDAGTGAGFPGIPLALALPDTRFTLVESTGKKARFVESVIQELALSNAHVAIERVEDLAKTTSFQVLTARAFAPMPRALKFLGPALKRGARALLFKGPDVDSEIAEAARDAKALGVSFTTAMQYELPDGFGARRIVEIRKEAKR